ncbi:hypothetical protein CgunFtcFv8_005352 [Champsocephalus gunnari]|uniref:Uncharacterized protein n=1 Tax=Champsocephalus gunnari TaxID=52237 RepID=A0AAN8HD24_CHAGU|nr:hypothetical protein CgunFtcFv8_005352 [Champsocephalus gunnari]
MEVWMTEFVGARKRLRGEGGGGGQASKAVGAPLKIPIDWPINLLENTIRTTTSRWRREENSHNAGVPLVRRRDDQ